MSVDFTKMGGQKSFFIGADPDDPESYFWNFGIAPEPDNGTVLADLYASKPSLYAAFPNIQGRWQGNTVNHINAVLQNSSGDYSKVEELIQMQPRGTCFPAGTLVLMADGTQKPIENIYVGDFVISHTGEKRKVLKIMNRNYTGNMYNLRITGLSNFISMTGEHPVYVVDDIQTKGCAGFRPGNGSWVQAKNLSVKQRVLIPFGQEQSDGRGKMAYRTKTGFCVPIRKIETEFVSNLKVYNIEVEEEHSYVADGIAVHNCGGRAGSATIDFIQHILIASGKRAKFHRASHAALYFLARKKYNMLGGRWDRDNNDGVARGAITEALKMYGEVTREEIGDLNYYGDGSDDLACKLGAGMLPDVQEKIIKLGADNICTEWTPVTSAQELADGIAAGGIGIGADGQGFTMQRDGKGFCRPSGTWQHYQIRVSVLSESDYGQKGFGYWQSWGRSTPDGPKLAGHPGNCFGVDWETQDYVCKNGAWAVVFGFPLWDLQQGLIDIPWNF